MIKQRQDAGTYNDAIGYAENERVTLLGIDVVTYGLKVMLVASLCLFQDRVEIVAFPALILRNLRHC